mgnify:CR=1 FL=1
MTEPGRTAPGGPPPGEDVQLSETAGDRLEWQSELDVAIADIDSRLRHPRRRATDAPAPAPQPGISTEAIDEIAWRVAELLRRQGRAPAEADDVASAISKTVAAPRNATARPALPAPTAVRRLPHGIAMTIRIRKPLFRLPWPFRRRRRQAMIMFSDSRIS